MGKQEEKLMLIALLRKIMPRTFDMYNTSIKVYWIFVWIKKFFLKYENKDYIINYVKLKNGCRIYVDIMTGGKLSSI